MDNTNLFKACVRTIKTYKKFDDIGDSKKVEKRQISEATEFYKRCKDLWTGITEIRAFLMQHTRDYVDVRFVITRTPRLTDREKDCIENETRLLIGKCTEVLRNLQLRCVPKIKDAPNQHVEHQQAVLEITEAYLKSVKSLFANLCSLRVKRALARQQLLKLDTLDKNDSGFSEPVSSPDAEETRANSSPFKSIENGGSLIVNQGVDNKKNKTETTLIKPEVHNVANNDDDSDAELLGMRSAADSNVADGWDDAEIDETEVLHGDRTDIRALSPENKEARQRSDSKKQSNMAVLEHEAVFGEIVAEITGEEMQMFEEENQRLYDELNAMTDEVRQIEGRVREIAELQKQFTEKVIEQDESAQKVAETLVGATENIKDANELLRKAIQNDAGYRVKILFFLIVLSCSLLFLDWFNP